MSIWLQTIRVSLLLCALLLALAALDTDKVIRLRLESEFPGAEASPGIPQKRDRPSSFSPLRLPDSPISVCRIDRQSYLVDLDKDMRRESTRVAALVMERRARERGVLETDDSRRRFILEGQRLQRNVEKALELLWKARKAADSMPGANRDEETRRCVEGRLCLLVDDVLAGNRRWPESAELFSHIESIVGERDR